MVVLPVKSIFCPPVRVNPLVRVTLPPCKQGLNESLTVRWLVEIAPSMQMTCTSLKLLFWFVLVNKNFAQFLVFLSLLQIDFLNLSPRDSSFEKFGHVINPMIPGAFCQKRIFWTFWRFSSWIWARLAPIYSKRHLQHDSMPFFQFPLGSRFTTFLLRHAQKSDQRF